MWPFTSQSTQHIESRLRQSGPSLSASAKDRISSKLIVEFEHLHRDRAFRQPAYPKHAHGWLRRFSIPIGIMVLAATGAVTIHVADAAKPGDTLFGIDRAVEKFRLAATIRESEKIKLRMDMARERENELQRLIATQRRTDTARAKLLANEAVDQALTSIASAASSINDQDREVVLEQLQPIQKSLSEISLTAKAPVTETHDTITATIAKNVSYIRIHLSENYDEFTLESNDQQAILSEIARRTNLTIEEVRSITSFTVESTPENPINTQTPEDNLTNGSSSNSDETTSDSTNTSQVETAGDDTTESPVTAEEQGWEITVLLRAGTAEIHANFNDTIQLTWELETSEETALLESIVEKTGLGLETIRTIWQVEQSTLE